MIEARPSVSGARLRRGAGAEAGRDVVREAGCDVGHEAGSTARTCAAAPCHAAAFLPHFPHFRDFLAFLAFIASFAATHVYAGTEAQIPYVITHKEGSWQPISGGTSHEPVAYSNFDRWDEGAAEIPLPFEFDFFGRRYARIFAFTNGFASFDPPPSASSVLRAPRVVPSPSNPIHNFIGVMWQDLDGSASGAIRSLVSGQAGERVVTIEWSGFVRYGATGSRVNFQIRLHETSQRIEIVLGPNALVANATSGLENGDGTQGYNLFAPSPSCADACPCSPSSCGSASWQPTGRTIAVALPEGPELTGEITAPPGASPGSDFDATLLVRNVGRSASSSFRYRVLLTTSDTSIASPVHDFGSQLADGLLATTSATLRRTLRMPSGTPRGAFFLALVIDEADEVSELSESNNVAFSDRLLTAPDLQASLTVPSSSGPGESIEVSFTLRSAGSPVAVPVAVMFYFSSDQVLDASDVPAGPAELVTMPDGFSTTESIVLLVPEALAGRTSPVYLLARVDSEESVDEVDEQNNLAISEGGMTISVADLQVETFVAGEFAFFGLPYPMVATVANRGGTTARGVFVCVFASDSVVINTFTDACLAKAGPIVVAPQSTERVSFQPVVQAIPACNAVAASPGSHYLGAVVDCDDAVSESVETNNIFRLPEQVVLRDPAPDLVPTSIETAPSSAAGESLPIQVRVANLGNSRGVARIRLVLSDNPGITAEDTTLDEPVLAMSIDPSEEAVYSTWTVLPGSLRSGAYYAGILVDPSNGVDEIREDNNTLASGPVVVEGSGLAIVSPPPPPALIGQPYTRSFAAVGGLAPHVWSLDWMDGAPPSGLTFVAERAEIVGTPDPSGEGRHRIRVRVTSGALSSEAEYALIVMSPTVDLAVVSSRLPPGLAGEPYAVQLVAVGGVPPYRWLLEGSGVPVGLGLSADGLLGGEPQILNAYNFPVIVEDELGAKATGVLSLDVVDRSASLTIETADVADATVGRGYEMRFRASRGTPPYRWSVEGSAIPGLSFDGELGRLSGTPTVAGSYPIIVEVSDSRGLLDRNAYVLTVIEEGVLRLVLPGSSGLPRGLVGTPYQSDDGAEVRLEATARGEAVDARWSLVEGSLPKGLRLDPETAVISGVPEEAGVSAFVVQARDLHNDAARATLVIEVVDPSKEIAPLGDTACACSSAARPGRRGARANESLSRSIVPSLWLMMMLGASFLRARVGPRARPTTITRGVPRARGGRVRATRGEVGTKGVR